jgi:uncharacterized Zn finger protein
MGWYEYDRFPRYVPVAERKLKAARAAERLKKKGQILKPIILANKTIASTFWGKAWCENLESYSDYDNRLPRGRTYVRNGSVIDLNIVAGEINAMVNGSSIYKIKITIAPIAAAKWKSIVKECAGKIDSLIELLQGKFSKSIMEIIARPEKGLFPRLGEIKLSCSCPDDADMCKHVAAALYGVGARLDLKPEELFLLRNADYAELISHAGKITLVKKKATNAFANSDLSALFGIDIDDVDQENSKKVKPRTAKPSVKKVIVKVKKQVTKKQVTKKQVVKKQVTKKQVSATVKKVRL